MEGFEVQENVSPDWLVNPATRRRLKLDQLYPQVRLAVRFVGLTARGQRRQSDWELLEEEQRNATRSELCRLHGVELFLLDLHSSRPRQQLQRLRTTLSRLSRLLAQGNRSDAEKATLMPQLAGARRQLDGVIRRVRQPDDLALYAELWRDREAALVTDVRQATASRSNQGNLTLRLQPGQLVQHARFGLGTVTAVDSTDGDPQITIQFQDGSQRTFLSSLVADKLSTG
jgi:hypothetical protein